jgi:hypothetical protein
MCCFPLLSPRAAPTCNEILQKGDLYVIVEALLEAKDKAYELGLRLKLSPDEVKSIRNTYQDPQERLTAIIEYLLKQVEPRPTWRLIVNALRSPLVDLPRLAEAAHCPNSTTTLHSTVTHDVLLETPKAPVSITPSVSTTGSQAANHPSVTATRESTPEQRQSPPPTSPESSSVTPRYVKAKIKQFEERFNKLKWSTRDCLKQSNVPVEKVVDALADMPADDVPEHKHFQETYLHSLYQAPDHNQLFGRLSPHVNYLSYHLLDHLVGEFDLGIKSEVEKYKEDLKYFREKTPLKFFCETQKKRRITLSSEFREVVAVFNWPNDVTLEVVEQFRQEYACHYKLRECAMMVAEIRPCSFIVTWYVPESVAEKLKTNVPETILRRYSATQLDIDGCVFHIHKPKVC